MITIIDYGMGNLGSIQNMFKYIGVESRIEGDLEKIAAARKILLPGVGSFDAAMSRIRESGLEKILIQKALHEKIPVLGICLGMQLLTESSEEGRLPGLGWIPAKTLAFRNRVEKTFKVPHMGWNVVKESFACPLFEGFTDFEEPRFYFVHSFFVQVQNERHSALKTTYGVEFDSAIQKDNIWGVQFHPEKSHKFGMKLFQNFARL